MEWLGGAFVLLLFVAVVVGSLWLWLWALVDAARASRIGWVVAIAILQVLAAVPYLIWGRPQNRAR